jgi:hypothetical protein
VIPLFQWLAEGGVGQVSQRSPFENDGSEPELPSANDGRSSSQALIDSAYERGVREGSAASRIEFHTENERNAADHAAREAALTEIWSERCSERISREIAAAFCELRQAVDQSLHRVLAPFVVEKIEVKARKTLLELVDVELSKSDADPIEIRAPEAMHEQLRERIKVLGLNVVLMEADSVEVISRSRTAVFEGMSDRWIKLLRMEAE